MFRSPKRASVRVAPAKRLHRASPNTGKRQWLRDIAAVLADEGTSTRHAIKAMVES